ncbi:MAG: hypothetical protein NWT08_08545 [Akkermansiaceae bacterium]|jgi:cell division protein FtsB|nr:hypothetical protein [Akkermansiaceae bacterium]MDP4647993.1 hypothetical protein [Akkermansiaceae bacterium]MDP4719784.1 hypothetical protein [Akkermansiaceae bacterium]MDP4781340.1 hypothetical protein [Akkermansiaceae bacterium]MDP4846095.1 hypothetical protein [Akkermansiaceae bacterium]
MARKKFTAEKIARMEGATRFIKGMNRLLYVSMAVAFGLLITATAIPQKRKLEELQVKLRMTQEREQETIDEKEHNEIKLQALREDTAYLEVQARDRLNYYREGERVLRFDPNR